MSSPATPVTVTVNANHPTIEALAGWSIRAAENGTTINLRRGAVDGRLLACIGLKYAGNSSDMLSERSVTVDGGVYVQVVTGSVDAGVLYSG